MPVAFGNPEVLHDDRDDGEDAQTDRCETRRLRDRYQFFGCISGRARGFEGKE